MGRQSSLDLLVGCGRPIGLFEFVRVQRELGERLGRRVELVTAAALKPQVRDRILSEAPPSRVTEACDEEKTVPRTDEQRSRSRADPSRCRETCQSDGHSRQGR